MAAPQVPVFDPARQADLLLLCAVAFLDFVDASIVNVALPSIRSDLGFSVQNLQWVLSGYLLTYGGFMLLGGRAADLLGPPAGAGRRHVAVLRLVAGGGLAGSAGTLIGARLVQGLGAAMMLPAALSILTTTFTEGRTATRRWARGAHGGLASAAGVLPRRRAVRGPGLALGVLRQPAGLPARRCARSAARSRRRRRAPAGELRRPRSAADHRRDAAAGLRARRGARRRLGRKPDYRRARRRRRSLLAAFVVNELRHRNPLFPFRSSASRASPPQTPRRSSRSPASTRCSSSSPSTCRTCWATRRSRPERRTCRRRSAWHRSRRRLAAVRAHRHAADHRRRRADLRRRRLLAVAHPGRRLLPAGPPARRW